MLEYEKLTEKIIGCAFTVYNKMGHGFLESVYEKSMLIELQKSGLNAVRQKSINVLYDGFVVGEFFADLVVEEDIIIELKSVSNILKAHEVQLVNYLTATETEVGLLLNFGEQEVQVKRKVKSLPNNALR